MNYLEKAEAALLYLAESEAEYARFRALKDSEKERLKILHASLVLDSNESSQTAKDKDALSNKTYQAATEEWHTILENYYLIEAKRKRAELTIEMYRSVNAAMKKGNI